MSTIRVFNKAPSYNNHLVQMTLEYNGIWFAFNGYMTMQEMSEAAKHFNNINVPYNYKQINSNNIGEERFKFNKYCFDRNVKVYEVFDDLLEQLIKIYNS